MRITFLGLRADARPRLGPESDVPQVVPEELLKLWVTLEYMDTWTEILNAYED